MPPPPLNPQTCNPDLDGDAVVQLLIKVVAEQLFAVYGVKAHRRGFLDMVGGAVSQS